MAMLLRFWKINNKYANGFPHIGMETNKRRTHRIPVVDEGRKGVIAIIAGILAVKRFREEESQRNGISPRAQAVISNSVAWAERIMRHVDSVFSSK